MTIISGPPDARDDVSLPPFVAEQLTGLGANVLGEFEKLVKFDPPKS